LKSPCNSKTGDPEEDDTNCKFESLWGLWRESEAFLRRQVATVFENSTACVKRRDLTTSVVGLKLTRLPFDLRVDRETFELKLKVNELISRPPCAVRI
jgi:hypothetical protein